MVTTTLISLHKSTSNSWSDKSYSRDTRHLWRQLTSSPTPCAIVTVIRQEVQRHYKALLIWNWFVVEATISCILEQWHLRHSYVSVKHPKFNLCFFSVAIIMFSDFSFITNIEDDLSHNYHLRFLLCFVAHLADFMTSCSKIMCFLSEYPSCHCFQNI